MIEEYEICNELKEEKEKELSNIISAKIKNGSSILKEMELAKIIQISAPQKPFWKMDFMIIDWHGNAQSVKPGNIILNAGKLIKTIPTVITTGAAMLDEKLILKICSFLIIWMEIGKGIIIDINEQEAYMMIAFWANCNHEQCISMEKGFQVVNELLEKNNKEQMKEKEYQKTIDNLIKICAIDVVENSIYLKEKIIINYE